MVLTREAFFFGVLRHETQRLGAGERETVRCTVGPKEKRKILVPLISWGRKKFCTVGLGRPKKESLHSWAGNAIFF